MKTLTTHQRDSLGERTIYRRRSSTSGRRGIREFHRVREEKGTNYLVSEGDVVTVYDEGHPIGVYGDLGR